MENVRKLAAALKALFIFTVLMAASTTVFAAVPDGAVAIGGKAFDLNYANALSNQDEINDEVVKGGTIFVKGFDGTWIDNVTGKVVDKSAIPKLSYKDAKGAETSYVKEDGDAVTGTDTAFEVQSASFISTNQVTVKYSSGVDKTTALDKSNYKIGGNSLGSGDTITLKPDGQTVIITLGSGFQYGNMQTSITVLKNISDVNKNMLSDDYSKKVVLLNSANTTYTVQSGSIEDVDAIASGQTVSGTSLNGDIYVYGDKTVVNVTNINGRLILDPGADGTVSVRGVTAKSAEVLSGASHSIDITNSTIGTLSVASTTGVEVAVQGTTAIQNTNVSSGNTTTLETSGGTFGCVTVAPAASGTPTVQFSGSFSDQVQVNGPANLGTVSGTAAPKVTVGTQNASDTVTLTGTFKVVVVNSPSNLVLGSGAVIRDTLTLNSSANVSADPAARVTETVVSPSSPAAVFTLGGIVFGLVNVTNPANISLGDNSRANIVVNSNGVVVSAPSNASIAIDTGAYTVDTSTSSVVTKTDLSSLVSSIQNTISASQALDSAQAALAANPNSSAAQSALASAQAALAGAISTVNSSLCSIGTVSITMPASTMLAQTTQTNASNAPNANSTTNSNHSHGNTFQKPAAPTVTGNDTDNTITGMAAGMEFCYSTDNKATWTSWTDYNVQQPNLPLLSGNIIVQIRTKASGSYLASDPVELTFTRSEIEEINSSDTFNGNISITTESAITLGPGDEPAKTINGDLYIGGNDANITLKDIKVNGTLTIDADKNGNDEGTVHLQNVYANSAVIVSGGTNSIHVEDGTVISSLQIQDPDVRIVSDNSLNDVANIQVNTTTATTSSGIVLEGNMGRPVVDLQPSADTSIKVSNGFNADKIEAEAKDSSIIDISKEADGDISSVPVIVKNDKATLNLNTDVYAVDIQANAHINLGDNVNVTDIRADGISPVSINNITTGSGCTIYSATGCISGIGQPNPETRVTDKDKFMTAISMLNSADRGTIILDSDITITTPAAISGGSVCIDLNSHKITAGANMDYMIKNDGGKLIMRNGTLDGGKNNNYNVSAAIETSGSAEETRLTAINFENVEGTSGNYGAGIYINSTTGSAIFTNGCNFGWFSGKAEDSSEGDIDGKCIVFGSSGTNLKDTNSIYYSSKDLSKGFISVDASQSENNNIVMSNSVFWGYSDKSSTPELRPAGSEYTGIKLGTFSNLIISGCKFWKIKNQYSGSNVTGTGKCIDLAQGAFADIRNVTFDDCNIGVNGTDGTTINCYGNDGYSKPRTFDSSQSTDSGSDNSFIGESITSQNVFRNFVNEYKYYFGSNFKN